MLITKQLDHISCSIFVKLIKILIVLQIWQKIYIFSAKTIYIIVSTKAVTCFSSNLLQQPALAVLHELVVIALNLHYRSITLTQSSSTILVAIELYFCEINKKIVSYLLVPKQYIVSSKSCKTFFF